MKNNLENTFRLGEFFCGAGGLALGAKMASVEANGSSHIIRHVWATDCDHSSCETYRNNICPGSPESVICEDIRRLDFSKLGNISDIDGFSFGFPCNDFSVIGERRGVNGLYGPLYRYGVGAIRLFAPQFFLAENVGGLRNLNNGRVFAKILKDLFDSGYSIYPHLYSFDKYGVPQARRRIIIIGIRKDLGVIFKTPSPVVFGECDISCKTAIENPPIEKDVSNNEFTRQSKTVIERLSYIGPGENAFTANIPDHLRLNIRGARISQIYKRLDPDRPAYTVTGSGGGGTHIYHWSENRALTNRERARLQAFPDDFIFSGSRGSVRRQIGMAVPCSGAKVIFEALLKSFVGVSYPHIASNIEPMIH